METAVEYLAGALLIGGVFFAVVGGIGLIRLPDLFCRMHGSGMTDTLGAGLILTGLALHSGFSLVTIKLIAVLFFLLVTSPTSTHVLCRAALSDGVEPLTEDEGPSSNA